MKEISATDLKQRLDGGEDIQIIDVREPNEYEVAHLENSKLIPHGEIGSRVSEIDRRARRSSTARKAAGAALRPLLLCSERASTVSSI